MFRIAPEESPCLIGRSAKCRVRFPGSALSRVQCSVRWAEGEWVILDGDGEKPSKNGTWVFAEQEMPVEEGTVLKAGTSLLRISLTPQPQAALV